MAVLNHLEVLEKTEKEALLKYETKTLYNHRKTRIGTISAEINN